jgi:hypothetical protein
MGAQGVQGTPGVPWAEGEPGEDGLPVPGVAGVQGATGAKGENGVPGTPGIEGEPGEDAVPMRPTLVAADIPALSYAPSALTSAHIFVGNVSNVATDVAMSGDATLANTGALTIANKAVSLAKMADMATSSLIYRKTAGAGAPEVNTLATLKTDLGTMPPSSHNVLDSTYHGDVLTGSIARGDILYGNATPKIARLAHPADAYRFLTTTATDVEWSGGRLYVLAGIQCSIVHDDDDGFFSFSFFKFAGTPSGYFLIYDNKHLDVVTSLRNEGADGILHWNGAYTLTVPQSGILYALADPGANTLAGWDDTDNLPTNITIGANLTYTHSTHTLAVSGTVTPSVHDMITSHSYTGGAALDVFGLSAANTLARLTPSANPGAAAAILASAPTTGLLTLTRLTLTALNALTLPDGVYSMITSTGAYILATSSNQCYFYAGSSGWHVRNSTDTANLLSIDSSGNVGVNGAPINKFSVVGAKSGATGGVTIVDSTSMAKGVGGILTFRGNYTGTTGTIVATIQAAKTNGTDSDYGFDLVFSTRQNGSGGEAERMRIDSIGNVGIGKVPTQILDVAGQIRTDVTLTTGAKTQARYFPMNINGTVVNVLTD